MTINHNNTSSNFSEQIEKDVAKSIKNAIPLSNAARLEVQAAYEEFARRNEVKRSNKNAFIRLLALWLLLFALSGCEVAFRGNWTGPSDYTETRKNRGNPTQFKSMYSNSEEHQS